MQFTINIAKAHKKVKAVKNVNKVSRLCLGTTIKDDEGYKIKISLCNDPDNPDMLIVPFTEESLSLKGKSTVYLHHKDKTNHYVRILRNEQHSIYFPGSTEQYTAVVEGVICSGYVIRREGKLYFDLKGTHGRGNNTYDLPKVNSSEPLFKK